ncbi:MAG: neutral zinc metallopeptidase [Acidimicrobiia bacterium]
MHTILRKLTGLVAALTLSLSLFATLGSSSAGALTPAQSTSTGSATVLYGDVNTFWSTNFTAWGWSSYYRSPTVHFYNTTTYQCGVWLSPSNSFACSGAYLGNIWFGTGWTQSLHNQFGDYGSGVILAHEWGHEIQYDLRWNSRSGTIGSELFADCLAGMYTRYGLTVSHKLNNSDYWEGYNTLRAIAGGDHGTPDQRSAWYQYGYSQYNIYSCGQALT